MRALNALIILVFTIGFFTFCMLMSQLCAVIVIIYTLEETVNYEFNLTML